MFVSNSTCKAIPHTTLISLKIIRVKDMNTPHPEIIFDGNNLILLMNPKITRLVSISIDGTRIRVMVNLGTVLLSLAHLTVIA